MANASRPVAPARKLIAAVLGTVATFVTLFGLGMTSWAIVALGVALLVLAAALFTVRAGGGRAWVVGEAHVQNVTEPPTAYAFGRCELTLVLDAPGLPPRSRKMVEPRVPVAKWPSPGDTLPVRVAMDDQRRIRILWDQVPTHAEAAADLGGGFDESDPLDEILAGQQTPPWAQESPPWVREGAPLVQEGPPCARRSEDDTPPPEDNDPLPTGLPDEPETPPTPREPVVVRQTPGGLIVLEGTLVEAPAGSPYSPRTSPATPRPRTEEQPEPEAANDPVDIPLDGSEPARYDLDGELADGSASELGEQDLDLIPGTADAPGLDRAINGIGITLLVTDLVRSVAFYTDVLGFYEIDGGDHNAVLASGSTRLVLREITEAAPLNRRLVHVNLEVSDIDAAYERLLAEGVRFTYAPRVVNRGARLEVWAAAFRDPDGHGIALTEWRDRPTS